MPAATRWCRGLLPLFVGTGLLSDGCGARTGLIVPTDTPCVVASSAPGALAACDGGTTSISGTVYDPAGKRPLYGVVVYVPSSRLAALPKGVTCSTCNDLYTGNPIATAITDADGRFALLGVPDGENIPLVVQIGKWRRQTSLARVVACQDNPQPDGSVRLPRSREDGELPAIAVSTGSADTLECLFLRMGVDPKEYVGGPGGTGSIHVFQGTSRPGPSGSVHVAPNTAPPGPPSAQALWDSLPDISAYDMVLLSCEGRETQNMNQEVLFQYAAAGGRVYATHFHYAWFDNGPFGQANVATWTPGSNSIGNINADIVTTIPGGQAFPQGEALVHWLGVTGATVAGELPVVAARHNADVGTSNALSQPWIVADANAKTPGATQYFSFNTPLGAPPASQCGQVVFTDIHVGAASHDQSALPVPAECADIDLSPQEKALEFLVFNLASCVTPAGEAPAPPPACQPAAP